MKKIVVIGIFCLLMLPASAFGHKLIPTDGTNIDYESALNIPDPVISWAMYEKLEDNALFYKFDAKKAKSIIGYSIFYLFLIFVLFLIDKIL